MLPASTCGPGNPGSPLNVLYVQSPHDVGLSCSERHNNEMVTRSCDGLTIALVKSRAAAKLVKTSSLIVEFLRMISEKYRSHYSLYTLLVYSIYGNDYICGY